jgi:hypothetical protein
MTDFVKARAAGRLQYLENLRVLGLMEGSVEFYRLARSKKFSVSESILIANNEAIRVANASSLAARRAALSTQTTSGEPCLKL